MISGRDSDWEVAPENAEQFLRLFFGLLLAFTLFRGGGELLSADFSRADFLWPGVWIGALGSGGSALVPKAAVVLATPIFFACLLFPRFRWLRFAAAAASFFLFSLLYSFGKLDNNLIGWPVSALVLAWCRVDNDFFWRRMNARLVWAAASLLLASYFLSGFSKLLSLFSLWRAGFDLYDLTAGYLPRTIGLQWINGIEIPAALPAWLKKKSVFTFLAFLSLLAVQLSSFWPIFRPSCFRFWGTGMIGFHLLVAYFLGVNFQSTAILLVVLLVAHPMQPMTTGVSADGRQA